jgi:hypothetical protein
MSPRATRYVLGAAASVLCFLFLWQLIIPDGPNIGLTTLAISVVSGFIGALVMICLPDV